MRCEWYEKEENNTQTAGKGLADSCHHVVSQKL
jgi:hypothetical protein